jgi:hypothetical protein
MSLDCCSSGSAVRHVLEPRRPQHSIHLRLADTEAAAHEVTVETRPLLVRAGLVRMDQQGLLCSRTAASQPPSIDPAWQACFTWRPTRGAETFMHHLATARAASSPLIAREQQPTRPCPRAAARAAKLGLPRGLCYWRSTRGAGHACLRPGPVAPEAWSCGCMATP